MSNASLVEGYCKPTPPNQNGALGLSKLSDAEVAAGVDAASERRGNQDRVACRNQQALGGWSNKATLWGRNFAAPSINLLVQSPADWLAVVGVGIPHDLIILRLISETHPVCPGPAREQLKIGARAASLDNRVKLVGFAAVFPLAGLHHVHLTPSWCKGSCVLALDAKKHKLGDVAEVEAHAAFVGAAVLPESYARRCCSCIRIPMLAEPRNLRARERLEPTGTDCAGSGLIWFTGSVAISSCHSG